MTNSKTTKRALLTSALAILACVAMLMGATFAWFTDAASTGVNRIVSGNLDVELWYKNKDTGEEFAQANKETPIFNNEALWEPGYVEYAVLDVRNVGSLALKYKLGINIAAETGSTNMAGTEFKLSDYIRFAVLSGDQSELGRDALVEAATAVDNRKLNEGYTVEEHLLPIGTDSAKKTVTLVLWMPTSVGNEANHKTGVAAPSIELGVNVVATQDTVEHDSFGNDYDKDAEYPMVATHSVLNNKLTLAEIPVSQTTGKHIPVEVTLGDTPAEDISYSEHSSGYTGKGVMLGNTNLNHYGAAPTEAGEYSFIFKNGTIDSAAAGYASIDGFKDTSVYMLVPGNSDVVFENMTFNGVVSFDVQMYTVPWSYLNSITFKNCTFYGIVVGACPANKATFEGCTFNNYTNATSANNSNPIWWRAANGSWAGDPDQTPHSLQEFTFVNNTVSSTRPVKIERIGWSCVAKITIMNNSFDISKQAGDTETKNMAINIGQRDSSSQFILVDDGNTISANTASLYTAALSSGSNQYLPVSGSQVLDGNGNPKTIIAMVWKTTTGETFEMKSID